MKVKEIPTGHLRHQDKRYIIDFLNKYNKEVLKPLKELLEDAQVVYGELGPDASFGPLYVSEDTHQALLLDIKSIEKIETPEEVLKDLLDGLSKYKKDSSAGGMFEHYEKRAKKALGLYDNE